MPSPQIDPHVTGKSDMDSTEMEPKCGTGDGDLVTGYELYQKRGYHQHDDGKWTRWSKSVNAVDA